MIIEEKATEINKKIRDLLDCFEKLCVGERYQDIIAAVGIFLIKTHKECRDDNFCLEQHAENLSNYIKINYINVNNGIEEDKKNMEKNE